MSDVTRILSQIESGDPSAIGRLLPLVSDELRKLAAGKVAQEKSGQTLQATALVHEPLLRLVGGGDRAPSWDNRGHFVTDAAEAMRRILVEKARRKARLKRGGILERFELRGVEIAIDRPDEDLLALDEALSRLAEKHPENAELPKLRYFAGLTGNEASAIRT